MTRFGRLIGLFVCGFLTWTGVARADAVSDWNAITAQTVANAAVSGTPPRPAATAVLDFAMVQAAVHDAVQAIEGKYEPYAISIPGASGSSIRSRRRRRRTTCSSTSFPFGPSPRGSTRRTCAYLAANGLIYEHDPGVAVGTAAAAGLIAAAGERRQLSQSAAAAVHRRDRIPASGDRCPTYLPAAWPASSDAPMAAEWFAFMTPFVLTSPDQFRPQHRTSGLDQRQVHE